MNSIIPFIKKYFLHTFSAAAILLFLLSSIFAPNFWSVQTADASGARWTNVCGTGDPNGAYNCPQVVVKIQNLVAVLLLSVMSAMEKELTVGIMKVLFLPVNQ